MKRFTVVKEALDSGKLCEWYNRENVEAVKAARVTVKYGKRVHYAAYFVQSVEVFRDDMRDFNPVYEVRRNVAGPFASAEEAENWKAANC